jgi:hypothetical protein
MNSQSNMQVFDMLDKLYNAQYKIANNDLQYRLNNICQLVCRYYIERRHTIISLNTYMKNRAIYSDNLARVNAYICIRNMNDNETVTLTGILEWFIYHITAFYRQLAEADDIINNPNNHNQVSASASASASAQDNINEVQIVNIPNENINYDNTYEVAGADEPNNAASTPSYFSRSRF